MVFVSQSVLLVEDDEGDRLLIRRSLQSLRPSIEIDAVPTIAAAQSYLSGTDRYAGAPRPRCLVLDLNLPDGRGEVLLDWMARSEWLHDLPVITLSADAIAPSWPNLVGVVSKPADLEGYERLSGALGGLILAAVDGSPPGNDNFGLDRTPRI